MLRRTDTFDPVCFLYAFLSCILKAETVKKTLLQADNNFQSPDKKVTCLTQIQIKVLRIFGKQRIKLDIFVNFLKTKHFFTLQNNSNFFHSFHRFPYFWVKHCIFFSKLLSATNQQLLCVTKNDFGRGFSNLISDLFELLVSVLWLKLSFDEVSRTCVRMH